MLSVSDTTLCSAFLAVALHQISTFSTTQTDTVVSSHKQQLTYVEVDVEKADELLEFNQKVEHVDG